MRSAFHDLLGHQDFREGVLWRTRRLPPNHTVFAAGDHGREVFMIMNGRVRVVGNEDLDEQRQVHPGFSELGEGQLFGELPLFAGEARSATGVNLSEGELAVLVGDRLRGFLDSHPDLGYPLF